MLKEKQNGTLNSKQNPYHKEEAKKMMKKVFFHPRKGDHWQKLEGQ